MNRKEIITYCLELGNVYEDYPFDDNWAAMRHSGNHKTFAFIYELDGILRMNLKCEPLKAELLRKINPCVSPAYHMNKVHWNMITFDSNFAMDKNDVMDMIEDSYELTRPKIKRKCKQI
jgi:Uncharacterized protein conserved in bacteria